MESTHAYQSGYRSIRNDMFGNSYCGFDSRVTLCLYYLEIESVKFVFSYGASILVKPGNRCNESSPIKPNRSQLDRP
jgi:hypothetical protein